MASMQATCKDMKAEMNKANSMFGYDIKQKHMNTMNGFFTAKNFELIARMDTPPPPDSSGAAKGKDAKGKVQNPRSS